MSNWFWSVCLGKRTGGEALNQPKETLLSVSLYMPMVPPSKQSHSKCGFTAPMWYAWVWQEDHSPYTGWTRCRSQERTWEATVVSRHETKKLPAGSKMRVAFLTLAMQHRTESSPLFPRFHVFAPVRTSVDLVAGWQGGGFRCLCCTIVQLFVDTSACDLSMMAIRTRVYIVRTYPLFVLWFCGVLGVSPREKKKKRFNYYSNLYWLIRYRAVPVRKIFQW